LFLFVCFFVHFFPLISLFDCLFCYCGFSIFIHIPIIFFLSILSTLPSSSSHPYSHPTHSSSFSCAKIYCSCPNNLFFPFSPTHPPALTFPSISLTTCLQTTPSSYTFITHCPTYYTNFSQPQTPAISTTSTLCYNNNRNIPKHTQGPQKPLVLSLLPSLTHPTPTSPFRGTLSNSPNFYR
jgi:hypothetical protein